MKIYSKLMKKIKIRTDETFALTNKSGAQLNIVEHVTKENSNYFPNAIQFSK
jgi:hypothetical protein